MHKFSFKIFKDWKQVPVEAGEEIEVAKFGEEGEGRGGWISPTLVVVRVDKREGAAVPAITGDASEMGEALRRMLEGRRRRAPGTRPSAA